jgi:hypothetical protein
MMEETPNRAVANNRPKYEAREETMSARNGDKARFGKNRKRRIAQRVRDRELRQTPPEKTPKTPSVQPEK